MAIPGPGTPLTIGAIADEFGGTPADNLSEYYRGGGLVPDIPANAGIPTSGPIRIGNFYGATNRNVINLTIAANTYNYDVYDNRGPAYTAGVSDLIVTVNPGVTVGSTSTPTYAMLVPSSFSPTDTVTIINNGLIQGMGGAGGAGGQQFPGAVTGGPGLIGGNAVYVNRPTVITNNGTLAAGGGGGGGGGGKGPTGPFTGPFNSGGGGGGGGGAGFNGGAGGAGGSGVGANPRPGIAGSPGTSPAGGAGGASGGVTAGPPGGAGGGRGAAGTAGPPGSGAGAGSGGAGGATGNYIVGNPFVTYPATGTREGGVA
jgi:hypothetical protein